MFLCLFVFCLKILISLSADWKNLSASIEVTLEERRDDRCVRFLKRWKGDEVPRLEEDWPWIKGWARQT